MPTQALSPYDQPYTVSADSVSRYQQDFHICLRDVCSGDVLQEARQEIHAAVKRRGVDPTPLSERTTYGKAFLQIINLWADNEPLKPFVLGKRFGRIAAELMGVEGVRIYHDQALFKEAGGGHTPWHQDQHYWPIDSDHTITMWMPLVDVDQSMGTMNFATGSHACGYLGDMPISDESEARFETFCADKGFNIINYGAMNAGDATFHSGWCLHGAPGNSSSHLREVMTIIFVAHDAHILPDPDPENRWNQNRRSDLKSWFPGCEPGSPINSHLNPIIWHRDQDE